MFSARTASVIRFSMVALSALIFSPMLANPAQASYVAATTYSPNLGSVTISFNGNRLDVLAGAFQTTLLNTNGTQAAPTFDTYCVDLAHYLNARENVNINAITTLARGNGAYVGSLYANFAAGATSFVNQAALQLAIWKTEYDGPGAMSNCGHFVINQVDCAVLNQAVYYYEHNKLVSTANVSYLQADCGQSLMGPNAVPEPASVAMLGMGLIAGAGYTIRHRRSIVG